MTKPGITKLKAGDRVRFVGKHPHKGSTGVLMAYEKYGPSALGFIGWRVRIDHENGNECYAKAEDLRLERRHGQG